MLLGLMNLGVVDLRPNLNFDTSQISNVLLYLGIAYLIYTAVRGYLAKDTDPNTPGVQRGPITDLLKDVAGLLTHTDSLGLPILNPVAAAASSGNEAGVVSALKDVFSKLNDKDSRSKILETLFWAQFSRWIEDDDRAKQVIEKLIKVADQLGYTITKNS